MTTPRTPQKLARRLTDYVATPCEVDHPAEPKSGDPCRKGRRVGFALTDEFFPSYAFSEGIYIRGAYDADGNRLYEDGETPVSFQHNEWYCSIYNAGTTPAQVGDEVYYSDDAQGAGGKTSHLVANPTDANITADPTAFAGLIAGRKGTTIAANTVDENARLELLQSPLVAESVLTAFNT